MLRRKPGNHLRLLFVRRTPRNPCTNPIVSTSKMHPESAPRPATPPLFLAGPSHPRLSPGPLQQPPPWFPGAVLALSASPTVCAQHRRQRDAVKISPRNSQSSSPDPAARRVASPPLRPHAPFLRLVIVPLSGTFFLALPSSLHPSSPLGPHFNVTSAMLSLTHVLPFLNCKSSFPTPCLTSPLKSFL